MHRAWSVGLRGGLRTGLGATLAGLSWVAVGGCTTADAPTVGNSSAELEVGPELEVEAPTPLGAGFASAGLRAGDHYLVLFHDDRLNWSTPTESSPIRATTLSLFGARLADDGTELDPGGFEIVTFPHEHFWSSGSACSDTGLCLFVFADFNGGPTLAVRVDGNQVLDAQPFAVDAGTTRSSGGFPARLAWDGEKFRTAFQEGGVNVTRRIGLDGAVEPAVPIGIDGGDPAVVCEGPRCLVVVARIGAAEAAQARMFDATGPIGDPFPVPGPTDEFRTAGLHWDGARYWLAYTRPTPGGPAFHYTQYVARVSADGEVLDPDGIAITPAGANSLGGSFGRDGANLIVTWTDYDFSTFTGQDFWTRVSPDGVVLDPAGLPVDLRLTPMCGPDSCLALGVAQIPGDFRTRVFQVAGAEPQEPGTDILLGPARQADAAAAWTGSAYAAVWRDGRREPSPSTGNVLRSTIHGVLLSPTMDQVAPLAVQPHPFARCGDAFAPSVAAATGSVLVAWQDDCGVIMAQALGADGQPLAPTFQVEAGLGDEFSPFVASTGSEYLVLWEHAASSPPRTVEARRYAPNGAPRSSRFQITANGSSPVAAFDGANYLLVWQRPLSSRESRRDLFAARMTPTGTLLDADIPIATLPNIPEDAQSVACGGGVCLVVWRHAGIQVRAVRVAPDGTVLDATPVIIPVDGPVATTSTTFDGEAFLIAWREETGAMRAAQVTPAGEVVAPGAFTINGPDPSALRPAVASNGAGHRIALHDRFDRAPGVVMRRVRARVVGAPVTVPDAGVPDASVPDASVPDASVPDAGVPDAAVPDAAVPDAAVPDASVPDAAPPTGDPDYVVSALGDPPASAVSGAAFSVDVTVQNLGGPASAASTTRFFLSVDTTVGGDRALTRTSAVPPLAAGASDAQTVSLSVPTGLASGSYFLLACADRGATVPESDDRNNCRASATTVAVTGPDLVVDAVVNPPASLVVGQSFAAGDSTLNQGNAAAASSGVAYYLSTVPAREAGARRLSNTRPTGALAPGGVSNGQVTVKVPSVAPGTYYLVACADISSTVAELDEQNNCAASIGTTVVAPTAR